MTDYTKLFTPSLRAVLSRERPPRLDEAALEGLRRVLLQKPTEHGFGCLPESGSSTWH